MKTNIRIFFILAILLFSVNSISGQQPPLVLSCENILGFYCNSDLSDTIPGLKIDSINGDKALIFGRKKNSLFQFKDVLYANDPNRRCDTLNHTKTYCIDNPESLTYNVFYPDSLYGNKIRCALPFIVLFHGGSFYECPNHDNYGIILLCRELSKRGFVVFDAEYRGGVLLDPRNAKTGYKYVSAQQILGIYRACQDARGAIRTIIYRQRLNNNGGDFTIDTNRMFLAGVSAGSIIAINTAYHERQGQIDSLYEFPGNVLGDLDAPFYYGDTTINYFPKIKGVLNMWGSLGIPKNYWNDPSKFFNANSNIPPLISFQGAKDNILYIGQQYMYHSADSLGGNYKINFNTERNCLVYGNSFSLNKDAGSEDAISLGADPLYTIFKAKGIPTEEYVDTDMRHGIDVCDTCKDNSFFKSDFGTGLKTQDDVYGYIASRTATFFSAVMNNIAARLGTTRFVDCENKRIRCKVADNSACNPIVVTSFNFLKTSR